MNPQGAMHFLVSTVFDIFIFLVLTRLILQLVRADFYNPISQFVVRATNPVLAPLRKLVPSPPLIDTAALVMVIVLIIAKVVVLSLLIRGSVPPVNILVLFSIQQLASLMLTYLFFAILIRIILSWVAPDPYNPMTALMSQITEPVMAPARKLLPPIGGLDLSPILVLFVIHFLRVLFHV